MAFPPLDGAGFRRHLDELDLGIRTLTALVIDGIPRATAAFLQGDQSLVDAVRIDYRAAQGMPEQLEAAVIVDIARRAPVGSDLRFLITVLRVAPALGRCLELVDHIAARRWLGPLLPADAAAAVEDMSALAASIWEEANHAWCDADPAVAEHLVATDDDLERVVDRLGTILRRSEITPLAAMQAVMVGRFYERLGDHAVDLATRARWYAIGG